jgi:predicted DNA-binding transcriptional regulator YafY
MSDKANDQKQPLQEWLPPVILKVLVFGAFAFVLYEALEGLGDQDLSVNRLWAVIGGMVGLLLLLAIDRLTGLKVSTEGVEATLTEAKVKALEEISDIENQEAAEAARSEILKAQSTGQVEAAKAVAVELNATRIIERATEAIRNRRKCYVRYRPGPDAAEDIYLVAPLDVKRGATPNTRTKDYLWVHSYETGGTRSLRLDRVLRVDITDETFDPAELKAEWKKKPEWNVTREW